MRHVVVDMQIQDIVVDGPVSLAVAGL